MIKSAHGFTLVEILVVVAIMAVVGIFTLSNYAAFGEDQNLKNGLLDIQSQLRAAQSNATANFKCNTEYSSAWQVEFADTKIINLKCKESVNAFLKKQVTLKSNISQAVTGTGSNCSEPPTINFTPLSGKMDLGNVSCISFRIVLTNSKTGSTKSLVIEQGGRIYAE